MLSPEDTCALVERWRDARDRQDYSAADAFREMLRWMVLHSRAEPLAPDAHAMLQQFCVAKGKGDFVLANTLRAELRERGVLPPESRRRTKDDLEPYLDYVFGNCRFGHNCKLAHRDADRRRAIIALQGSSAAAGASRRTIAPASSTTTAAVDDTALEQRAPSADRTAGADRVARADAALRNAMATRENYDSLRRVIEANWHHAWVRFVGSC